MIFAYNRFMNHKIFSNRLNQLTCVILSIAAFSFRKCDGFEIKQEISLLELSDYVTIVITVPETHADVVREAMGRAGAGKVGDYSHFSSVKGIGRFMPNKGSKPYLGKEDVLEEIKKAHPYEETVIDICPVYEIGRKKAKGGKQ